MQSTSCAIHDEVLIIHAILTSTFTCAIQAKMPIRIHVAVADRLSKKISQPADKISIMNRCSERGANAGSKFCAGDFVSIKMEHPRIWRQSRMSLRPAALSSVMFEGMLNNLATIRRRPRHGRIRAKRIDDKNATGNGAYRFHHLGQRVLRIQRQNNDGERRKRRKPRCR